VGPRLNETNQMLVYVDDVNLVGNNIDTIKNIVIDANKEAGLDINTEKTKHMLLSQHQNSG
jgi:hypothetical protein